MTAKLIIYQSSDDTARAAILDKLRAIDEYAIGLSGSTYGLNTSKSIETIVAALTPATAPEKQLRFYVVEVTKDAAVGGYSSTPTNPPLSWLNAMKKES